MLLRRALAASTAILVLGVASSTDANVVSDVLGYPLRWAGDQLLGGTVDKLKTAADATVANVDTKLTQHEDHVAALASGLLVDAKGKVDDTIDRLDHSMEARLLQINTEATALVDHTMAELNTTLRRTLAQADGVGTHLITLADSKIQQSLNHADDILRARIADIDKTANDFVTHADDALKSRIDQLDEVAGRRLGDVDVIATKQRIAFERTALRVGVLIGLIVFVVFVVRGLWTRFTEISDQDLQNVRGAARTKLFVKKLAPGIGWPLAAALVGASIFYVLYQQLPLGAEREAQALTQLHVGQLEASVGRFDYVGARFHASQLQYLEPESAVRYDGLADKTELLRDLADRPTLLSTRDAVESFQKRVQMVARKLGPRPDPDVLVMQAVVAWEAGSTRTDEHQAASLAARALRLRPRGFPLAPLARAYVETFLDSPCVLESEGLGRDAAPIAELRESLLVPAPDGPDSPFSALIALTRRMRTLERASTEHYVAMVKAQAEIGTLTKLGKPSAQELAPVLARRTSEAQAVVDAWSTFDADLLKKSSLDAALASNLFRLNDAILTRALWFVEQSSATEPGKRLEELPKNLQGLKLRVLLAPARVVWARRYHDLFTGPARLITSFSETERFRQWERWAIEFEESMTALGVAEKTNQGVPAARWRSAVAAAALGLYVQGSDGRAPYSRELAGGLQEAPMPALAVPSPRKLDDVLRLRGPRLI